MELETIFDLLSQYGVPVLLAVTLLEGMNCPGLPAGVILPAAGIYAAHGSISLALAVILTVIGGLTGGLALYLVGRIGGAPALDWLKRRSSTARRAAERCERFLEKGDFTAVFIGRILPVVRTIIPLPAGVFRVPPVKFLSASVLGITCYNVVCVGAGYFLGHALL